MYNTLSKLYSNEENDSKTVIIIVIVKSATS